LAKLSATGGFSRYKTPRHPQEVMWHETATPGKFVNNALLPQRPIFPLVTQSPMFPLFE
jgi:hypothetical protein